ncbi:MAG: MATE family efflux transporter [Clostridia bacterium]|nr:MATE family efflux transporter [Clostridia bacterium]
MSSFRKKYLGDKAFYKMVLAIVIPIMVQNAITNFVSLLDNIMVGQVGTEPMSGVAVANQLMFVFNLCVFGGISGAGIYSAQFHGADNQEGVRSCFRFKLYLGLALCAGAIALFLVKGEALIGLYLNDVDAEKVAATLRHGMDYLRVMLWGLPAFALSQIYASTLREGGETGLPMRAGVIAVFVNLVFNYLLIFGHLGLPALGVRGAAIATVLSRYVELFIVAGTAHRHPERFRFIRGLYATPRVPADLAKAIAIKGAPLLINEALWSLGMATLTQCYSLRGLDVVAAMNISTTVSNLFAATFLSMGTATAIIVGQSLGANDLDTARDRAWKLIAFSIFLSLCGGALMLLASPLVPRVYRTEPEVRRLATHLLMVYSLCMPLFSYCNSAYFILRSGGKTMITFFFDSGYTWVVAVPLAWCLVRLTTLDVRAVYLLVQLADIIKVVFGHFLIARGSWLNNMVS